MHAEPLQHGVRVRGPMGLEIENERRLGEVIGSHFDSGRCLTLFMQVTGGLPDVLGCHFVGSRLSLWYSMLR